ncbi:MAG TPA: nitrous oxide reductase family maturation protein NosD [Gemmatimonadaceae bacterium]
MTGAPVVLVLLAQLIASPGARQASQELVVDPDGPTATIAAALERARNGDRIRVRAGVYREPTLRIGRAVTITGEPGAVLDGEGVRALLVVEADDVTVRGLTLRNTGASQVEDRAAILVRNVRGCRIEQNILQDTFFGIYLQGVRDCEVSDNDLRGPERRQTLGGNGIHVWQSQRVGVHRNRVAGHRDGVYFEFVTAGEVTGNRSEGNQRYGLHFMFSDDCRYEDNVFRSNESGIAVMYTRRVYMARNRFEENWGGAAYGLLLKDITDSEILDNVFSANTVGLYLEGANRIRVEGNTFAANGWALRVLANSQDNVISHNIFTGNSFDVGTNSRQNFSTFVENFWDRYRGYDLDRDGFGDVPFAPVRLFALVVEQTPAALILLRSPVVDLLDFAERVMPMLTPATLVDERPLMKSEGRGQRAAGRGTARLPGAPTPLTTNLVPRHWDRGSLTSQSPPR